MIGIWWIVLIIFVLQIIGAAVTDSDMSTGLKLAIGIILLIIMIGIILPLVVNGSLAHLNIDAVYTWQQLLPISMALSLYAYKHESKKK